MASNLSLIQTRPRSYNVFHSTTIVDDFCGVDDIEESKDDSTNHKTTNATTNRLKNLFLSPKRHNNHNNGQIHQTKRDNKKTTRYPNKSRKTKKKKCKSFRKLKKNKKSTSISPTKIKINNMDKKILWRPSLQTIFKDKIVLNALIKYMKKSYNSENILFLQSVKELNNKTINIDTKIISIYNVYIVSNAEYQINLSYDCWMNILSKRDKFMSYSVNQKRSMFNQCVDEIELLIFTSILPSFYTSPLFQNIAKKSKYYKQYLANNKSKYLHVNYPSNSSSTFNSSHSSFNTSPIKLDMSLSTECLF